MSSTTTPVTALALGEVMLRFDPGAGRIRTARSFDVHAGGGEYNVIAGLAALGMRAAIVTALPDTETGALAASLIRQAGVATDHVILTDDDGLGGRSRVGLNFTERGFGVRPPLGVSDRAGSAAARMRPGDVDWNAIFGTGSVRWLHTGGVFTSLSPETGKLALEAVTVASAHGVSVSYDVNFRQSLHGAVADREQHAALVGGILEHVDVLISNEPEYLLSLGEPVPDDDASVSVRFERMVEHARRRFPRIRTFAATERTLLSASRNDWGGLAWEEGRGILRSRSYPALDVFDRVGGGDAFVAGLIHGLLEPVPLQDALDLGVAHGALAMTTPGDVPAASLAEVRTLAAGGPLRTVR